jgi:hypothetical protein
MQSWVVCTVVALVGVATVLAGVALLSRRSDAFEHHINESPASVSNRFYRQIPRSNFGPAVLLMLAGMILSFGGLISLVVVLQNQ